MSVSSVSNALTLIDKLLSELTHESTPAMAQSEQKESPKLHSDLVAELQKIRKERAFDSKKFIAQKCELFNDYMRKCGLSACVVSVSGGVDSAVTLGLMKHAQNLPNSPIKKVLGISQPIHSSKWAYDRAVEVCNAIKADLITIDQTSIFDSLRALVDKQVDVTGGDFQTGQLRSYMRTPVGYYVAQLLSQQGTPCVVMGTGNKDEDGYLAYFCKAGDGVVDIQLIADIHKSEVFAIGKDLGVPASILDAAPSADLWSGQTDEDELGFTYDFIEFWTNYLEWSEKERSALDSRLSSDGLKQLREWGEKAKSVHRRNQHKINSPKNINVYQEK